MHTNIAGCSLFNVPSPHLKSNKHIEKLTRYSKFRTGVPAGPPILVSVPVFQDDCRPSLFHLHSLSITEVSTNLLLSVNTACLARPEFVAEVEYFDDGCEICAADYQYHIKSCPKYLSISPVKLASSPHAFIYLLHVCVRTTRAW